MRDNCFLWVKEVSFGFPNRPLFSDLSFCVPEDSIIAVFGANGTGKSSLLRMIGGELTPEKGEISLSGEALSGLAPHEIRRRGISLFPQGGPVFPRLTVGENLSVCRRSRGRLGTLNELRLEEGEAQGEVKEMLKPLWHKRAGVLSSGERQLLALTMVLSQRAKLYLLDEPTACLSPRLRRVILHWVESHCSSAGSSALVVEQNQRESVEIADRVLALRIGRYGTVEVSEIDSESRE